MLLLLSCKSNINWRNHPAYTGIPFQSPRRFFAKWRFVYKELADDRGMQFIDTSDQLVIKWPYGALSAFGGLLADLIPPEDTVEEISLEIHCISRGALDEVLDVRVERFQRCRPLAQHVAWQLSVALCHLPGDGIEQHTWRVVQGTCFFSLAQMSWNPCTEWVPLPRK